ncbi:MAG: hypothetical protein DGJ47_000249 [Rickettsiaceae bacterium]
MKKIQEEIDKIEEGTILEIKLLNIDELNILIHNTSAVIEKFHSMIEKSCEKFTHSKIVKIKDPSKIYVILSDELHLAEKLAYMIYSQVQLYVDSEYPESYLKCSIGGIKFQNKNYNDIEKLLSHLNYSATLVDGYTYYHSYEENPIDLDDIRQKNINLNLLRAALFKKEAKFAYQPIIDSKTKEIDYYECLLRIPGLDKSYISAGPIIQDAEMKGLINIVDITVIEMVMDELYRNPDLKLSVNVSNIGVLNKRLLHKIEQLLKKYDVASRLIIEITETALNQNIVITKNFISVLHSYGCQIALDDFGSGFTSFKQLLRLPIDIIKIDGAYIKDILNNEHHRFFVEALINLSHDLKIKTVAEFVETKDIADYLAKIKVDGLQGNYFAAADEERK